MFSDASFSGVRRETVEAASIHIYRNIIIASNLSYIKTYLIIQVLLYMPHY